MARNSEKAMTALARWRRGKEEEEGGGKKIERRPYLGKDFFLVFKKILNSCIGSLTAENKAIYRLMFRYIK